MSASSLILDVAMFRPKHQLCYCASFKWIHAAGVSKVCARYRLELYNDSHVGEMLKPHRELQRLTWTALINHSEHHDFRDAGNPLEKRYPSSDWRSEYDNR